MSIERTYALVEEAQAGAGRARDRLLARLRPRIVLWCAGRMSPALRARVDPEDAAQEILLSIHGALPDWRGTTAASFFAWVFRIAENRIRDLAGHHGARKRTPATLPEPAGLASPAEAAQRTEAAAALEAGLAALSEDYRQVVRLRRIEERSRRETAEILGRSEDAVRVLYWRAMKALARILREKRDSV